MIIVSITGPSLAQAHRQMKESQRYADLFEHRLDLIGSPSAVRLADVTSRPVIATCRSTLEGGTFRGSEEERCAVLTEAARLGASYVDIELALGRSFIKDFRAAHPRTRLLLSFHSLDGNVPNVPSLYRRMKALKPDVVKLAYMAHDAHDISHARQFLTLARKDRQKAIAVAMGESGEATRIIYRKLGAWATYASAEEEGGAAPGQIPAKLLSTLYRARKVSASTRIFGVIGNPLAQSKGAFVHNPLFHRYKVNAVYCRFPAIDVERFMTVCAPMLNGFSVTIPHKHSVMKYLDDVDETAKAIGAVNTVVRRRGRWFGTNTDAPAALDAIETVAKVNKKRVLVVGAGGAARAIAYEATQRGAHVFVTNRTDEKAHRLAQEFGLVFVPHESLREVPFDILVNATSVGMMPNAQASPVPKTILMNKIVFDAVYNPPMTKLLRDAVSMGATIVQGTEMYVNQAARQFALYTGIKPPTVLLRKLLAVH